MKYFFLYIATVNIISFVLFGVDKRRAVSGGWRISERTLLISAAAGGGIGALAGMYLFHHKTRKRRFTLGIPLIILAETAAAALAFLYLF